MGSAITAYRLYEARTCCIPRIRKSKPYQPYSYNLYYVRLTKPFNTNLIAVPFKPCEPCDTNPTSFITLMVHEPHKPLKLRNPSKPFPLPPFHLAARGLGWGCLLPHLRGLHLVLRIHWLAHGLHVRPASCIYIYICVYVYVYVCMYTYMYMYMYMYMYLFIFVAQLLCVIVLCVPPPPPSPHCRA